MNAAVNAIVGVFLLLWALVVVTQLAMAMARVRRSRRELDALEASLRPVEPWDDLRAIPWWWEASEAAWNDVEWKVKPPVEQHRVPGDPIVDHRDRNPLNNSKDNLRLATYALNNQNRGGAGSSVHRGVWWDPALGKWRAAHTLNYRKVHIGVFATESEAAAAAAAWREIHMPFSAEGRG